MSRSQPRARSRTPPFVYKGQREEKRAIEASHNLSTPATINLLNLSRISPQTAKVASVPSSDHFNPQAIQLLQFEQHRPTSSAGKHVRGLSLSQRVAQFGDEVAKAEKLAAREVTDTERAAHSRQTSTSANTPVGPAPHSRAPSTATSAAESYFTANIDAVVDHEPEPVPSSSPTEPLTEPLMDEPPSTTTSEFVVHHVDPTEMFHPSEADQNMNSVFGHSGRYAASSRVLPGKALKASLDLGYEKIDYGQRPPSGSYKPPTPRSTRPTSSPPIHKITPTAVPESLTGLPLSFFGVSRMLTPGQAKIQEKWLSNIGVTKPVTTGVGPLSPRHSSRSSTANQTRMTTDTQSIESTTTVSFQPTTTNSLPFHTPIIPSLSLPLSTDGSNQPSQSDTQPSLYAYEALAPQYFEFSANESKLPQPPSRPISAAPKPSSRPSSSTSTTSRSNRIQASVNAATAATDRSTIRPDSATSSRGNRSRPVTASKKPSVSNETPSNIYSRAVYVTDEKDEIDHPDQAHNIDRLPETDYQRWLARMKVGTRPQVGSVTERPVSGVRQSRPQSSTSSIRSRPQSGSSTTRLSRDPSARPISGSQTSRTPANQLLVHYEPQSLVQVSTLYEDARGAQFDQRAQGLLITTRARPPFSARRGASAHSTLPITAKSLRPNAGFQTELIVAHDMLNQFIEHAKDEEKHFYSRNLFWDYKLSELLRATVEEGNNSNPHDIVRVDERPSSNAETPTIIPTSDHVYPNTYRTLCTSAILKQVIPTLIFPKEKKSNEKDKPSIRTVTHSLLSTALDLLHRSIYQPSTALIPPPPPAHTLDSDLGRSTNVLAPNAEDMAFSADFWQTQQLSSRAKRLAEIEGSGYSQQAMQQGGSTSPNKSTRPVDSDSTAGSHPTMDSVFAAAMSDEGKSSLLRSPSAADGRTVSVHGDSLSTVPDSHSYPIPFFLSTKYLYESNQQLLIESEKTSEKIVRIEGQISKIYRKVSQRLLRVTFHIWCAYVRLQKQKCNLSLYLTKNSLTNQSRRDPVLIFHMWKFWAKKQQLKRSFRMSLKTMQNQIKSVAINLHHGGAKDNRMLQDYFQSIQSSFQALESESKYSSTPVDIFSPMVLHMLFERYQGQLQIIESFHHQNIDLLPLCETYSKTTDLSMEVNMILNEIARIESHELAEVRSHLLTKLESMARRESNQETALMESLLYISSEDFLLKWVNKHLSEIQSGLKLEDLTDLAKNHEIYLSLLKSIAPNLVDKIGKDMFYNSTSPTSPTRSLKHTPAASPRAKSSNSTGTTPRASKQAHAAMVMDAEARVIQSAKLILEVCANLGCLPVITLEEFLAHPNHGSVLARVAADKIRMGGKKLTTTVQGIKNSSSQDDTSQDPTQAFFSSHPADAGLTPKELGMPVNKQGDIVGVKHHMFDELAAETEPPKSTQPDPLVALAPFKFHHDSSIRARPHLHLSLLAAIFLQRPSLPISSTYTSIAYTKDQWADTTRTRILALKAEWEIIKTRKDVSLFDIQLYMNRLGHIGLEIDIILQRAQRRSTAFEQLANKIEDLLWILQKRRNTGVSSASTANQSIIKSIDASSSTVRHANLLSEVPMYSEIPMGKLLDVLINKEASLRDYEEIKKIIGRNYGDLANIFRHYSSLSNSNSLDSYAGMPSTGASMSFTEFMLLIVDCKLLSKQIHKGILHVLFTRCAMTMNELSEQSNHTLAFTDADRLEHSNLDRSEDATAAAGQISTTVAPKPQPALPSTSYTPHYALSQADLFETFIRLGIIKYGQVTSLPERVRRLIEMDILPHACRLKLDEFRSLLNRDRVKHVFLAHKQELQIIFHHFAKEETPNSKSSAATTKPGQPPSAANTRGKLIDRSGFIRLVQEARLFTNGTTSTDLSPTSSTGGSGGALLPSSGQIFNESHLSNIFTKVLRLPDHQQLVDFDMSYPEYLESLGAIACFKYPDPYLPVQVKVENFLSTALIPNLKKVIRRLYQLLTTGTTNKIKATSNTNQTTKMKQSSAP